MVSLDKVLVVALMDEKLDDYFSLVDFFYHLRIRKARKKGKRD